MLDVDLSVKGYRSKKDYGYRLLAENKSIWHVWDAERPSVSMGWQSLAYCSTLQAVEVVGVEYDEVRVFCPSLPTGVGLFEQVSVMASQFLPKLFRARSSRQLMQKLDKSMKEDGNKGNTLIMIFRIRISIHLSLAIYLYVHAHT